MDGKLEASLRFSGIFDGPSLQLSNVNGHLAKQGHSKLSDLQAFSPRLLYPLGRDLHGLVSQDEEILFAGGLRSSSNSTGRPSIISHPSLVNKLTEPRISDQKGEELHPFGLFWHEHKATCEKHYEASNTSFDRSISNQFGVPIADRFACHLGAVVESNRASVMQNDVYRNTIPDPDMHHDNLGAYHISHLNHEPNSFDVAEKQLSEQYLRYLQPQAMRSSHPSYLNDAMLEQGTTRQKQLGLIALRLQQQRPLQHQHLRGQQEYHEHQMLLKEQKQQSHARQLLLEQVVQSRFDATISNSALEFG